MDSDNDTVYSDYSDPNHHDEVVEDDEEVQRDVYDNHEEKEDVYLTNTQMITNTCLYKYASSRLILAEKNILPWSTLMLKVIDFLVNATLNTEHVNMQQLYNEVNLAFVELMLNVPIQLNIVNGTTVIDLNGKRRISYFKQPFHEPTIILQLLLKHDVIKPSEIRDDVHEYMSDSVY